MNEYLIWRLIKLLAVSLLVSGVIGGATATRRNRIRGLQWSSIGFALTWIAGYAMLASPREQLSQDWIFWAIGWSLMALFLHALYAHGSTDRAWLGALALASVAGAIISMVLRDESVLVWIVIQIILFVLSLALFYVPYAARKKETERSDGSSAEGTERANLDIQSGLDAKQSWIWFQWIARFEGLSIILLMLIYMPLKYAAEIVLDNGTGWVGWIHGVMFVLYVGSLLFTGIFLGWSWKRMVMGFVAAQFPFGSFIFEWNCHQKANLSKTDK